MAENIIDISSDEEFASEIYDGDITFSFGIDWDVVPLFFI